ncbi:hypothetical protein AMTRI_Chr10g7770 [Amborella trichopoda]
MADAVVTFLLEKLFDLLSEEAQLFSRKELEWLRKERRENDEVAKTWVAQVREAAYEAEEILDKFTIQFCSIKELIEQCRLRRQVGGEIRRIKSLVVDISKRKSTYKLENPVRIVSSYLGEADIVGFDKDVEKLSKFLLDEELELKVVSVVVSQTYGIMEVFKSILRELRKDVLDSMSDGQIIERLKDYCRERKYLAVLDDVWDPLVWENMRVTLIEGGRQSRTIITTRNAKLISLIEVKKAIHEIEPLREKDAQELFHKKAFNSNGGSCPKELQALAEKLLEKYEGLPLAIVVMGGLMDDRLSRVLSLSFEDLPSRLKSCFLHWIAEGFVEEKQGKTMEDVAKDYLTELLDRKMLQIAQVEKLNWTVESASGAILKEKPCRLSLVDSTFHHVPNHSLDRVRSFMQFEISWLAPPFMDHIFPQLTLLRVLHIESYSSIMGLSETGNLVSLRYLHLDCLIGELPVTFQNLQNLRTLVLMGTQVVNLPKWISRLVNLRHLFSTNNVHSDEPLAIGCLRNLQTLASIVAKDGLVRQVRKLTELRCLHMAGVRKEDGEELAASIGNLRNLLYLDLVTINEDSLKLEIFPSSLEQLRIDEQLEKPPSSFISLGSLTKLWLCNTKLSEDPFMPLQALPNLAVLILWTAYTGKRLGGCRARGFPNLNSLVLYAMEGLGEWGEVEERAMPGLLFLRIRLGTKLRMLPQGFERLKGLEFSHMPMKFVERLHQDVGEDHYKVRYIPNIEFL